ncbi:MAG TPA: hypothetical protein VHC42_02285 [Rhizomicrobium sp.]|nr:hypothetical protein [Rhizomicrobium sp.]
MKPVAFILLVAVIAAPARAADFSFDGYGDARLVMPPSTESYIDGGLGKLRYSNGDEVFQPGDVIGEGRLLVVPELTMVATGRINVQYGLVADLLEGYLRYRPVSTTQWRWSVKVGAFFPPLSLENQQVGWSTFWTITPSAINSWVGEELRTIGAEAMLEWRHESGPVTLTGAVFGWNDPAGVMIADRGWTFDDRYAGLFEHSRLPDATGVLLDESPPLYAQLFTEMDDSPGWYADLSWEPENIGGFEVMRYDNEADPTVVKDGQVAWRTRFWDVGFQKQMGKITLLSQAMSGNTFIQPSPFYSQSTDFKSAYVLLGYDMDAWWAAARFDVFQTRTEASFPSVLNEDGHAVTVSLNWLPAQWIRLGGELLWIDDRRDERALDGESPQKYETQLQLLARVYF